MLIKDEDLEISLKELFDMSEIGGTLSSEDVSNVATQVRKYQGELALQDQEIDLLKEKIQIMSDYITTIENTYQRIKEGE